jgi:GntR family transcriptional repressor for pyruvate dehydrogenase complex
MPSEQGTRDIYQQVARGSLTEQVVYQIEELVLSGDRSQGEKLPSQRDLAARLGVSPTVIREAVRVLEQKGLLDARAGSGTYVSALAPEACSEILRLLFKQGARPFEHLHEARRVLEIEIAGMAAARAQPHYIEQMDAAIMRMGPSA